MLFKVSVEKYMYATGAVVVEADSADDAIARVSQEIETGVLQTVDVNWGEPGYEDYSFGPTGDVDNV
jgi:hypothetical protein